MTIEEEPSAIDKARTRGEGASLSQLVNWLRSGVEPEASDAAVEIALRFQPLTRRFWREHAGGAYEDFVQEVLLRLFTALRRNSDVRVLPGLLKRIVVGVAADYWRTQAKHDQGREPVDPSELDIAFQEEIAPAVAIRVLSEQLSPREREVVELTFLAHKSSVEISSILGVSEGAVRMTKARALRRLREVLNVQLAKKVGEG